MIASTWARFRRHSPAIALDALLVILSFFIALYLRFAGRMPAQYEQALRLYAIPIAMAYCVANYTFGLYHRIWRYASSQEVISIAASTFITTIILVVLEVLLWPQRPVPIVTVLAGGFFAFTGFTAVRYQWRLVTGILWRWQSLRIGSSFSKRRVLIIGAGEMGQLLAWQIQNQTQGREYHLIGFIDDDPKKVGMMVHGVKVLGGRDSIPSAVASKAIDLLIIAIRNLQGLDLREFITICQETEAQVKVLPDVFALMKDKSTPIPLRDVTVDDLLGRKPVSINLEACRELLEGKLVLVTGAAGSIGAELCRQIMAFEPGLLLMLDNNETGLHDLTIELETRPQIAPFRCVVGDITNKDKLTAFFQEYRPQVVFHAAAYKHVPLMEENADEGVRVNILGTLILSELADEWGVEKFVLVSTDKAVNPVSAMGLTKWISEILVVEGYENDSKTLKTAVRFGNVLGSRGSVVPTFWRQIELGGPVTVTHPNMRRYFMSIPEAVSLIIEAATLTQGGDIFMLDMGEEIKILDLAHRMVRLRGLRVGKDIKIRFTGMRPGERLRENLVGDTEQKLPTRHPSIFRILNQHQLNSFEFRLDVEELLALAKAGHRVRTQEKLRGLAALYQREGAGKATLA